MRALLVAALLLAAPAAARDLGTMPLSGQMAIAWIAVEDDGAGGFVGRYRARGGIDEADGEEALLGGFDLACHGTMKVAGGRLLADEAACRATGRHGNAVWLDLVSLPGPWDAHALTVQLTQGSGLYARLSGSGTLLRLMHQPPTSPGPWGSVSGSITWRRE